MRLKNVPAAYPAIENSPYCITDGSLYKGKWETVFDAKRPLYLEIGMGKGDFIIENATTYPDINFLGMELYESVMYRGLQKYEALPDPLKNLRFLRGNAEDILSFFEKGEVDRIYLNFSDPWPKDRHAKRRLTSPGFLSKYLSVLSDEGQIEFKTDNADLFEYSVDTVNESPDWNITGLTRDLHHDSSMNEGNIMTEYEKKFSAKGNPIHKMIFKKAHVS